jgi:hypothetical protein
MNGVKYTIVEVYLHSRHYQQVQEVRLVLTRHVSKTATSKGKSGSSHIGKLRKVDEQEMLFIPFEVTNDHVVKLKETSPSRIGERNLIFKTIIELK